MPPPRPRGIGCSTGIAAARPNQNTPMSERQQMALLIQMTASSSGNKQAISIQYKDCFDMFLKSNPFGTVHFIEYKIHITF